VHRRREQLHRQRLVGVRGLHDHGVPRVVREGEVGAAIGHRRVEAGRVMIDVEAVVVALVDLVAAADRRVWPDLVRGLARRRLVLGRSRRLALRRTVLIQHPAGKPLGNV